MSTIWRPSEWGKRFTRSEPWEVELAGDVVTVSAAGRSAQVAIGLASPIDVRLGAFWAALRVTPSKGAPFDLDGLPNARATALKQALSLVVAEHRRAEAERAAATRRTAILTCLRVMEAYRFEVDEAIAVHDAEHRWFTTELTQELQARRPSSDIPWHAVNQALAEPDVVAAIGERMASVRATMAWWQRDLASHVADRNAAHMQRELQDCKELFDQVEKMPLTDEQRRAVVCMDSRVLTVAAAGSGKTSTMVAKAAYAVHRNLFPKDAIVLLAFNQKAAAELGTRVKAAFERVGLDASGIATMTFHKLGSDIIGQANQRKRRVAPWIENDGVAKLGELIRRLRDADAEFGTTWDLFRFVFSRDVPRSNVEVPHEDWIGEKTGFRTVRGTEVVKSLQELTIANWLYFNGVEYVYESAYEVDTATSTHSQYRPDFFYPGLKLYHEHFALDADGRAPPQFPGYVAQAEWKRNLHRQHGTELIETRSAQFYDGSVFTALAKELTARGVALDPNPYRPVADFTVLEDEALTKLLRTFLTHAKSNALSIAQLRENLSKAPAECFRYRHEMFLNLYAKVRGAWDEALEDGDAIDFEDMLIQSSDHLEAGRWRSPYQLLMVDEFQDASTARARLSRGLVHGSHRHLFAVGDDWQSINRFAGADISVMTRFNDWFGQGPTLRLEETFRCPQALCDISSGFVSKNPAQLRKTVRSATPTYGAVVEGFQVADREHVAGAIRAYLASVVARVASGAAPAGRNGRISVFVLGRYNNDERYVPSDWKARFGHCLDLTFGTVHGSKGLEADYVVLPSMVRRGFPSSKQDDPILLLAMPSGDDHPFAEERRLFYVALTRARRSVALFTQLGKVSDFVMELMRDGQLTLTDVAGEPVEVNVCPQCRKGVMVRRVSRFGPWFSCSNYPLCQHKYDGKRAWRRR